MSEIVMQHEMDLEPRASCEQCRWSHGPSPLARDRAKRHAERKGHAVSVITEHIEFWRQHR